MRERVGERKEEEEERREREEMRQEGIERGGGEKGRER